ncbi:hypothetical protein D3C85_1428440 [compost metagenome]
MGRPGQRLKKTVYARESGLLFMNIRTILLIQDFPKPEAQIDGCVDFWRLSSFAIWIINSVPMRVFDELVQAGSKAGKLTYLVAISAQLPPAAINVIAGLIQFAQQLFAWRCVATNVS